MKPRSFRQIVVPRPLTISGFDEQHEALVVVGMPCVIDSVEAQLFAPVTLRNTPSNRLWVHASSRGTVRVQLYQSSGVVFGFDIPTSVRERKRYQPTPADIEKFDDELPLFVSAIQGFAVDPDSALPEQVRIDLTVHLIPDFYEG